MDLSGAWSLHHRVSPDRWCITRRELSEFVALVRQRWETDDLHVGPGGPDLYEVNERVVKPVTLAAGGMSYALMKHPTGLACEVFISHSWREGIFHLESAVRQAWPQFQALRNLYCCLLANPQNLDINALLGGDLNESPFAKALEKASHLLVVPNPNVGVYSRLWCVYEAYLGVQMHKTYLLPVKPRGRAVLKSLACHLWPALCGILSGIPFMLAFDWAHDAEGGHLSSIGYVVCCFYWVFSAVTQFCILMAEDRSWRLRWLFRFLLCLTFLGWGISMPWLRWCDSEAQRAYSNLMLMAMLHYGGPFNMTLTNTAIVYVFSRQLAEDLESERQEKMMQFRSVRAAHCSCPFDEQRIRLAIEGSEEEVDKVIGILVKAGAYTDQLREAYEMGKDLRGMGYTSLLSSSVVAMIGWIFVAADSVSNELLMLHMPLTRFVWLREGFLALAAVCCITVFAVFLSTLWANYQGPDRAVFVVRSWATCAIWTLLIPLLTTPIIFRYDVALMSPIHSYFTWKKLQYMQTPSDEVMLLIFVPRCLLVLAAWVSAFTDPLAWRRPWMKGIRRRVQTIRCSSDGSERSDSSSENGSDSSSCSEHEDTH